MSIYFRVHGLIFLGAFICNGGYISTAIAAEETVLDPKRSLTTKQNEPALSDVELPVVVVSASRLEQAIDEVIPSVTVISRAQIERSQASDLSSLLRQEAGIELFQNGGMGTLSTMQMRGASATQVLVLLDGIELGSASSGFAQIEQIMSSQIDHIEIVHGNVSALYGSQAIGGVVRIFTQPQKCAVSDGAQMKIATQLGALGTRSIQGRYAQCGRTTSFSISGARRISDSFPTLNVQQAPNANENDHGYQNTSLSGELKHTLTQDWNMGLRFFQSEGLTHFSNPYGSPRDINYAQAALRNISLFVNGTLSQQWRTKLSVAQVDDVNDSYSANSFGEQVYRFRTTNRKLIFQNELPWLETDTHKQTTLLGYEYLHQSLDSNSYDAPVRKVDAVFIGQQMDFKQHHLQANLRHDRYSDAGNATSYFLGYAYDWRPALKSYINFSSAFRAPTFNELYYPGAGNLALQPERARSLEIGARYTYSLGEARIAVFQTNYRDLVSYVRIGSSLFSTPISTQQAQVTGMEFAASTTFLGMDIKVNATVQNPRNQTLDTVLPSRSRYFGSVVFSKKWGQGEVGALWHGAGKRFDISNPSDKKWLAGYGTIDLVARYNIDKEWQLLAKLENVFDHDYQLISRYNTPRRGLYLTLAWSR